MKMRSRNKRRRSKEKELKNWLWKRTKRQGTCSYMSFVGQTIFLLPQESGLVRRWATGTFLVRPDELSYRWTTWGERTPTFATNQFYSFSLFPLPGPPQFVGDINVYNVSHCGTFLSYELRLHVAGFPLTITWTKDSVPLKPDARVKVLSSPYRSLLIRDATPSDFGLYQVTLRNRHGSATQEVQCCGKPGGCFVSTMSFWIHQIDR